VFTVRPARSSKTAYRREAIARTLAKAVAMAPRLLLLSEPTRGVDNGTRSATLAAPLLVLCIG
jgi:ABC-type sulfate/molybdate transport systems ATPase subunit